MSRRVHSSKAGFPSSCKTRRGFSLVELLVATVILLAILAIIFSITMETTKAWKNTTGKVEGFRTARAAFDALTRTLSQATLNTYYDYVDANGNFANSTSIVGTGTFVPQFYARQSDLHFICGQGGGSGGLLGNSFPNGSAIYTPVTHAIFFQAPLGMVSSANASLTSSTGMGSLNNLLNACGFYVAYGPDPSVPTFLPSSLPIRYRYRLMQFTQPSDYLSVYQTSTGTTPKKWFTDPISTTYSTVSNFVLGENIVALVIWPKYSAGDQTNSNALTTDYSYDSRASGFTAGSGFAPTFNQLPPVVEVAMIAIDEPSALKLGNPSTPPNAKVGLTSTIFTSIPYVAAGTANQLQTDLQNMQTTLAANHLNYRVFQTEVAIRGAKWTSK